jgi:hypothetical protein
MGYVSALTTRLVVRQIITTVAIMPRGTSATIANRGPFVIGSNSFTCAGDVSRRAIRNTTRSLLESDCKFGSGSMQRQNTTPGGIVVVLALFTAAILYLLPHGCVWLSETILPAGLAGKI